MFGWLRARRDGADRPARRSRLTELLASYPPYVTPYPPCLDPKTLEVALTVAQAESNLHHFLDVRIQRLDILARLLEPFDIDLKAGMNAHDPKPVLDALDRWARDEWPSAYRPAFPVRDYAWLAIPKDGDHIVLSMLMDTAIALGEIAIRRRSDYAWRLELDRRYRDTVAFRRVVLMAPPARPDPDLPPFPIDLECQMVDAFDAFGRHLPATRHIGYVPYHAVTGTDIDLLRKPGVSMGALTRGPHAYDKAKYHEGTVVEYGLLPEQASIPAAFLVGWLVDRAMLSPQANQWGRAQVDRYKRHEATALDVYARFDHSLSADLLTDQGNAFLHAYYDSGNYEDDLRRILGAQLPSVFHIPYSRENQARMNAAIDRRFADWQAGQLQAP